MNKGQVLFLKSKCILDFGAESLIGYSQFPMEPSFPLIFGVVFLPIADSGGWRLWQYCSGRSAQFMS